MECHYVTVTNRNHYLVHAEECADDMVFHTTEHGRGLQLWQEVRRALLELQTKKYLLFAL